MSEEERTELNSTHPRLRPVEAFPVEQNGTRGICLRDPHRYSESMLFVPEGLIPLLQLMDGSRSLGDVQAELTRRFGSNVPTEELQALVDTLDRAHFLNSERFAAHRAEVDRRFLESPVRDAYLAGQAYPDSPDDLARYIDELLLHPDGPGAPPPPRVRSKAPPDPGTTGRPRGRSSLTSISRAARRSTPTDTAPWPRRSRPTPTWCWAPPTRASAGCSP